MSDEWLVQLNVSVPKDVSEALADYCRDGRVRKRLVVEIALRRFLAASDLQVSESGRTVQDTKKSQGDV